MKLKLLPPLLGLLVLAGCASFQGEPKSPPGTPQRACEDAADADPSLRDIALQRTPAGHLGDYNDNLKAVRQQYVQFCLMQKGVSTGGGVDKVRK